MQIIYALALVVLGLSTGVSGPGSADVAPRRAKPRAVRLALPVVDHSALDSLLRENVRGGLVDYRHIRATRLADLDRYLDRLAAIRSEALPRDEQLAFDLDLYNASMIRAVIARLDRPWSPSDSAFAVFHEPLVRTAGGTISLDSLEHGIIRARFHEPRVHVALVCAARSCPPLLARAYRGADLDRTLEKNLLAFATDPRRNRVDEASRTLRLSPIFKWYEADFAALGGPIAILSRARGRDFRGWTVAWLDYDWSLNSAP